MKKLVTNLLNDIAFHQTVCEQHDKHRVKVKKIVLCAKQYYVSEVRQGNGVLSFKPIMCTNS
jgi:hypothetical protein